ncbi:helix-turn-helix domain-containing protein [Streptomyces radicis]|uniref:XRE family transcriptional regulator n=1 Tax=Streptomyces radicis TaxID=1750517 RepID=A0A3A9WWQ7_9ACTN|nr:helix-turn-helix transcriptional regulator [Streptomyces radicis]RKN10607.1 XRE family transcriptional regulator [Streptomyces radicis]RKN24868.1 XRE family transcriptional regulator [Streptomyces radicis]
MASAQAGRASAVRDILAHPRGGPTVLRIVLGTHLRRLREACGITREAAGDAIRGSHAKISRLELGRVGAKERDIADLLTLYGVEDESQREQFLTLARQANVPGWWQRYSDVLPPWFETMIGLEEAASVIRTYEVQFIPGLLQTADYARACIRLGNPRASDREVNRRVELRMERQRFLMAAGAPKLWAVVDEAALRRPLGGDEAMRQQIKHLRELSERPNITVQIAPFRLGGLAAAGGPITILRFLEPDLPDIVYLEQLNSALYLDKRDDVEDYLAVMDSLCATAEPHGKTAELLDHIRLRDELKRN